MVKNSQTSFFDGNVPKGTLTRKEIEAGSSSGKYYGGLDIHELTTRIRVFCEKYDGEYKPNEWNGTACIYMYHSDIGVILDIVKDMDALVKQYEFRSKTVIHHHVGDKLGFRYMVGLTVPGPLRISHLG